MHLKYCLIIVGLYLVFEANLCLVVRGELVDTISALLNVLDGQRPNNENGTFEQFKDQALNDKSNDEIYDSTTQEIIERSGYKQNTFEVTSDDGYITTIINIINPLADREIPLKQPPVMLFHGGVTDTSLWIWGSAIQHHPERYPRNVTADGPITSSNRSLAFTLANNGYDVWLIGTRGSNKQNLGHTKYKARPLIELLGDSASGKESLELGGQEFIDTLKYFDYSMDELVAHEFPRQIEAVLSLTGSDKVSIVGVSFSTQIMFQILTSNEVLSKRIHSYVSLVPLLNSKGADKLVKFIIELVPKIPTPIGTIINQFLFSKPVRDFLRHLDRYKTFKMISTLIFGSSPKYLTFLEDPIIGHLLLSTGFKEIKHYAQQIIAAKLQKFDHGQAENVHLYASFDPPEYDLSLFKLKRWMIIAAGNDVLGTPSSSDQYVEQITKVKPYKYMIIPNYNHLDSIAAFDVDVKVNLPILEFFDRFQILSQPDEHDDS